MEDLVAMSTKTTKEAKARESVTYDSEVLSILAFEFSQSDHEESDRKIKRRLRDKKLGAYDAARVEHLRTLKYDIQFELGNRARSKFYTPAGGPFSAMEDWQFDPLARYLASRHPDVAVGEITRFLPYAIYLYYLR